MKRKGLILLVLSVVFLAYTQTERARLTKKKISDDDEIYFPVTTQKRNLNGQRTTEADSLALVALYNATDGDNWSSNENWLQGNVETWYGVGVTDGSVDSIRLVRNELNGVIPEAFYELSDLRYLRFAHNPELTGPIADKIGELTSLEIISLFNNALTGELPETLTNLINLTQLSIQLNDMEGTIPSDIGNLTELTFLGLSEQSISGDLPESIGNLQKLEFLFLNDNPELSGNLSEISGINTLTRLDVSNCNFSGDIPVTLAKTPSYFIIGLSSNDFTSMPDFSDLTGMLPSLIRVEGNVLNYDELYFNRTLLGANTKQQPFELIGEAVDSENESLVMDYDSFLDLEPQDKIASPVAYYRWTKDGVLLPDETEQVLNISSEDGEGNYQLEIQSIPFVEGIDLSSTVNYTTSAWCGSSATGQATIEKVNEGIFVASDFSFGGYEVCYGTSTGVAQGDLVFYVNDGEISIFGIDAFGDTWWLNSAEVDGPELTLRWANSYNESGTSVLTREDGEDWPELTAADRFTGTLVNGFPEDFEHPIFVQSRKLAVTVAEPSSENDFLAFGLPGQEGETIIDAEAHTIALAVPSGTEVTSVAPNFELSRGAVASIDGVIQVSGETVNDFSTPVTVNVVAQDGQSSQDWIINVNALVLNTSLSSEISVYPNPTARYVQIEHPQFKSAVVFDASGKKMISATSPVLDLLNFQSGIYFATIELSSGERWSTKLIKR